MKAAPASLASYTTTTLAFYFLVALVLHIVVRHRVGTWVSLLFYTGGGAAAGGAAAPSGIAAATGVAVNNPFATIVPSIEGAATAGGIAGYLTGYGAVPGAVLGGAAAAGGQSLEGAGVGNAAASTSPTLAGTPGQWGAAGVTALWPAVENFTKAWQGVQGFIKGPGK